MTLDNTDNPRARYYEHVLGEIESIAWEHVSAADLETLSVKSIAAKMGVSSAALYRYIGSRDKLLDALAVRAATELVDSLEELSLSVPDCTERVVAIAGHVRRWAHDYPGRFTLVFRSRDGQPRVPTGVVDAERRVLHMITSACASAAADAPTTPSGGRPRPRPARHRMPESEQGSAAPEATPKPTGTTDRALSIWTRVLGTVEMELTGHLGRLGVDVDDYFEREIRLGVSAVRESADRVLNLT